MPFCTYCRMAAGTTKDHVVPLSLCRSRGIASPGITVPCCQACNHYKADQLLHRWNGPVRTALLRLRVGELLWKASLSAERASRAVDLEGCREDSSS